MRYLETLIKHILQKPSVYLLLVLVIFSVDRHRRYEGHKDDLGTFYSDVYEYYRYLPDLFIYGAEATRPIIEVNKRTIGMAILYSPGFVVGHIKAKLEGAPLTGYSEPYQWAVRWGTILYVLLGLFFCRLNLLMFFNELTTCISLIGIFFASNLFYYTYTWGEYPHSYLFSLNSVFIYCVLQLLLKGKQGYLPWIGLLVGFITLIRPTGIVVILFPLLFNVQSVAGFIERLRFLLRPTRFLVWSIVLFCLPLLTQMLMWKFFIGKFVHYSYGDERFYFNDPQIINFLFSYRKGWLLYTPLMGLAILGLFFSYKILKPFFLFMCVFLSLNIYILSSWWDWTYGGSFGCRVMVDFYSFLIFPLAAFISRIWDVTWRSWIFKYGMRLTLLVVFYLLIELNFLQSMQIRCGIMHWDGVSKESYWLMFGKSEFNEAELQEIRSKNKETDPEKMKRGERDNP